MSNIIIKFADNHEINFAIELCSKVFSEKLDMSNDDITEILSDNSFCVIAKLEDNIIGAYFLTERNIEPSYSDVLIEDLSYLKDRKGIEGLGLAVDKAYRGLSVGDKLKAFVRNLGYDYIFGAQYKDLNNIKYWENSGRRVVGDGGNYFVTLEDFKKKSLGSYILNLNNIYFNQKLIKLSKFF